MVPIVWSSTKKILHDYLVQIYVTKPRQQKVDSFDKVYYSYLVHKNVLGKIYLDLFNHKIMFYCFLLSEEYIYRSCCKKSFCSRDFLVVDPHPNVKE